MINKETKIQILFLEDREEDYILAVNELKKAGINYKSKCVDNKEDYLKELNQFPPEIIISDYSMPAFDGMKALEIKMKIVPDIPFVILTGSLNETIAVECMKAGADDYVLKDKIQRLVVAIPSAIDKKKSQSELKKLSSVVEQTTLSIIITDKEGNIEYVNPFFEKITGYKYDEVLNKDPKFLNSGKMTLKEISNLWKTINAGGIWRGRFYNKRKNGELYWESSTISPIYDGNNEITHFVSVGEDITQKIEIEKSLMQYKNKLEELVENRTKKIENINTQLIREIEKQKKTDSELKNQITFLNTLIQTIPNPFYLKDRNKTFVDCNEAFVKLFNSTKDGIIGKRIEDLRQVQKRGWYSEYVKIENKLLEKPGIKEFEFYMERDGRKYYYLNYLASVKNYNNEIIGILGIVVDITQRKKLEDNIVLALEKEKELNEMKSNFISFVSHEFRTPLTSILTTADFLELRGLELEKSKIMEHIKRIQDSVVNMNELLEDVLTLTRTEKGSLKFDPKVYELKKMFLEVVEEMKLQLKSNQELIVNKFDLYEKAEFDKKLLKHILENLISNAIKFSTFDGIVLINAVIKEDNIMYIEIIDGGIGIPKSDLEIIFEPFARGRNASNYKGSGLGLSIVKTFVKMHNGTINIKSEEKTGTHITLEIPVIKVI